MIKILCLFFIFISCGPPEEEDIEPSTKSIQELYDDASKRLVTQFLEHRRVVSWGKDSKPENAGDSLIWSGIALYGLPCDLGSVIESQIVEEMKDGFLMRHPTLEPNDASLDGALGLYFGIADRISRCTGSKELWSPVIKKHIEFVKSHGNKLNPNSGSKLEKYFDYVLFLLGSRLGVQTKPTQDVKLLLGLEIGEWARATIVAKKSCFRIHLGWLALKTVESLGENWQPIVKDNFCDVTRETQIPVVDHYCGRASLKKYIADFKYDQWEYRHQRCGLWETPDAGGFQTPAVDYLLALRLAYTPLLTP